MHLVAALLVEMQRSGGVESGRRLSKEASAARRLADEIVPKWSNASAANTMEYATSLKAIMVEGRFELRP